MKTDAALIALIIDHLQDPYLRCVFYVRRTAGAQIHALYLYYPDRRLQLSLAAIIHI